MTRPLIGVLALQGDVREHLAVLRDQGAEAVAVRRPEELAAVDGLVLPGGESTTIAKLARRFGLLDPLRAAVRAGSAMVTQRPLSSGVSVHSKTRHGPAVQAHSPGAAQSLVSG